MLRYVRGYFALGVVFFLLAVHGLYGTLGGALFIAWCLFRSPVTGNAGSGSSPLRSVISSFCRLSHKTSVEGICGAKLYLCGDVVAPAGERDVLLLLGPHPPEMLIPTYGYFMTTYLTRDMVVVIKSALLVLNPFLSWTLLALGAAVPVSRASTEKTRSWIERWIKGKIRPGSGIVLFPDQRWKPGRHKRDLVEYAKKIPGISDWMRYTSVPRAGALIGVLEELRKAKEAGLNVRVVMSAFIPNVDLHSYKQAPNLIGASIFLHMKEIPFAEMPGPDEVHGWLNERCKEWNALHAYHRGEMPLGRLVVVPKVREA
ncbi:MAG: hypothetical protein V4674_02690 [Patescibacteria group bacterium]